MTLVAEVRARIAASGGPPTPEVVTAAVREAGAALGSRALAELVTAVRAELTGAGPLQPLVEDPAVTDVLVNGPRDVWVERAGVLQRVDIDLGTADDVRALAVRLAAAGGERLDDASPAVDARLPDGTRLHAVLPPVSGDGAVLSLRVLRAGGFALDELVARGSVAPAVEPVLRALVASRANLLIAGGTGTGKTTLLASLLGLVPPDQRIVCLEEARELAPDHPHVVHLVARRANVEGAGEVGLAELVRHALRMRPDRLVLGECRGAEVRDVLTALNTGHDGGCATVHANRAHDVPARLAALAGLAGMTPDAVAAQAASAFDAVLHLRRGRDGVRFLAEVAVVRLDPFGRLEVVPALTVAGPERTVEAGSGADALAERLRWSG